MPRTLIFRAASLRRRVRPVVLALVVTFLVGDSPSPVTAQSSGIWQRYMEEAAVHARRGDLEQALREYRNAARVAEGRAREAKSLLAQASLLVRLAVLGNKKEERVSEAEQVFKRALAISSGELRFRTYAEYSGFLLRRGRPEAVRELLGSLETRSFRSVSEPSRSILLFNMGTTEKLLGDPQKSFQYYALAATVDPTFDSARREALEIARGVSRLPDGMMIATANLVGRLLATGRSQETRETLTVILHQRPVGGNSRGLERLADVLIRFLAAEAVPVARFHKDWRPLIEPWAALGGNGFRDVLRIYSEPFRMDQNGNLGSRFSTAEGDERASELSQLLHTVARGLHRNRRFEAAAVRYRAATSLSPRNLEAATYLSTLLVEHASEVDPDHSWIDPWILQIEEATSGLSRSLACEGRDAAVCLKDLRFLFLELGDYRATQGAPGKPTESGTAMHFWRLARQTEKTMDIGRAPGLAERMARGWEALGLKTYSRRERLDAARIYGESNQTRERDRVLEDVLKMGGLTPEEQKALRQKPFQRGTSRPDLRAPTPPKSPGAPVDDRQFENISNGQLPEMMDEFGDPASGLPNSFRPNGSPSPDVDLLDWIDDSLKDEIDELVEIGRYEVGLHAHKVPLVDNIDVAPIEGDGNWSGNLATAHDNPLLTGPCDPVELEIAVVTIMRHHAGVSAAAAERLAGQMEEIRGRTIVFSDLLGQIASCESPCRPLLNRFLTCYTEAVKNSDHDIVFFEPGSAEVTDFRSIDVIAGIAEYLQARPQKRVLLLGRDSQGGSLGASRGISYQRGAAVRDKLRDGGVEASRIAVLELGHEPPQIDESMADAYDIRHLYEAVGGFDALNRSVMIVVY